MQNKIIQSSDFDFRHHLFDTLILLGAPRDIAQLVKRSEDFDIQEKDISELRKYNLSLINANKDRLKYVNTIKVNSVSASSA